MTKRYRVKKILNNNVVYATSNFLEYIVIGLGIGFHLRVNQRIPNEDIEKVFALEREDAGRVIQLAAEVPEEMLTKMYEIIDEVSKRFDLVLNQHAYIAIIDHIQFSVNRMKNNQFVSNLLAPDLLIIYPDEFAMATALYEEIVKQIEPSLPEDEIGFLTIHIVNGLEGSQKNQSSVMTESIYDCLNIIRDHYLLPLKFDDMVTQRTVIHLKMLIQRVIGGTQIDNKETLLYNVVNEFENAYNCALKIQSYLEKKLNSKLNAQEIVYLTIHLNRIEVSSN